MSPTVMKKAVHKIVLSDREIAPGTHFPCPESEIKFLTEAGAITDVKRTTAAEAQATVSEPTVEKPAETTPAPGEGTAPEDEEFTLLSGMNLPSHTVAALEAAGIETAEALAQHTEASLDQVPRIGKKSITEIKEALAELGMALSAVADEDNADLV